MRIIAGTWRGRAIEAPGGHNTRPTNVRAREALFSMLASRVGSFEDLEVVDLFAGSGALGLEALSRGAARCRFVEKDGAAVRVLKTNIERLGASSRAEVLSQAVETLPSTNRPADLLLLDPPYASGAAATALSRLDATGWIAPGAWLSVETARNESPAVPGFEIDALRDHGKARLHILRRSI